MTTERIILRIDWYFDREDGKFNIHSDSEPFLVQWCRDVDDKNKEDFLIPCKSEYHIHNGKIYCVDSEITGIEECSEYDIEFLESEYQDYADFKYNTPEEKAKAEKELRYFRAALDNYYKAKKNV